MTGRSNRETEAEMRTIRRVSRTIIATTAILTLHGGVQLGAWAIAGDLKAYPATQALQGIGIAGALLLILISSVFAGEVIPPGTPDEPPAPAAGSLVAVTPLSAAALSVFGNLSLTETLQGTAITMPPGPEAPEGPRGVAVAASATLVGFMLWITACDWMRQRRHLRIVSRSW